MISREYFRESSFKLGLSIQIRIVVGIFDLFGSFLIASWVFPKRSQEEPRDLGVVFWQGDCWRRGLST